MDAAAAPAQAREVEVKRLTASLVAEQRVDDAAIAADKSLAALAGDILHLYRTQDFRRVLLESYEPLPGLKKVDLDSLVQDCDDRIYNLRAYARKQP
jgi:hypothetical protein